MSRRKNRKFHTLSSDAELDLHGFTLFEAEIELERFLYECKQNPNIHHIRIVTGKGIHSPLGRKTLYEFVEMYLTERNIHYEKEHNGSFLILFE